MRDELSRPLAGVRRELVATQMAARRLGHVAGRDAAGGLLRTERATGRLRTMLGNAHGRVLSMSSALGRTLVRGATAAAVALGAASAAATFFGLKAASTLENGLVALESLTGSAEKAQSVFSMLKELDVEVPFDLAQMQHAAVALISIGTPLSDLREQLVGISNITAGTADPQQSFSRIVRAITQMRSLGRVSAEELNQLVDAGVGVARFIPEAFGMSLQEARDKMERGHDFDPELLINAMFGSTEGFAARAQQTLTGMLSSLRSTVMVEMSDASSPLLEAVKGGLPEITEGIRTMLREVAPPLVSLGVTLLGLVTRALPILAPLLGVLAQSVEMLATAGAPMLLELEPVIAEIGVALQELTRELLPVMPDLVRLFIALLRVLPAFLSVLTELIPSISALAGFAATLLEYEGVAEVLGVLLTVLLGYRALSAIVGTLYAFAGGLTAVNMAGAGGAAGGLGGVGGAAGKAGIGRFLGPAALGITGAGTAYGGAKSGNSLATVGGAGLTGAALGSVVPGVGTVLGGLGGLAVGGGFEIARNVFGKDSKATPAAQANTLDAATIAAIQAGQAEARALEMTVAPGGIVVHASGQIDYERGLARGIEQYERDRSERG
jgi:tape measure domain-containing protein